MATVSFFGEKDTPGDEFKKACFEQDTKTIGILIETGAVSPSDITQGFLIACRHYCLLVLEFLFEKGVVSPNNFEDGLKTNHLGVVQRLIAKGAIPTKGALQHAIFYGNAKIVSEMLTFVNSIGVAIPLDENILDSVTQQKNKNEEVYKNFEKNPHKLEKLKQCVPKYMKMAAQDEIAELLGR
jgi:hypothetical protein